MAKTDLFSTLGRRKSATARVRLTSGKGSMQVNHHTAAEYFADSKYLLHILEQPFATLDMENKFDITALVTGGGHESQAEAIRLGIAKALAQMNEDLKGTLKRADLLSRNPRDKERKKFGFKGARKKRQFTKR